MKILRRSPAIRWLVRATAPLLDLPKMAGGLTRLPKFFSSFAEYRRLSAAKIAWRDLQPVLGQDANHEFDRHYIFLGAWAARRIANLRPAIHTDIGSQISFATVLSASIPVRFIEFREVPIYLSGFESVAGDLLHLPFADGSVDSVSCLHVIEHVGLGRYGDPLDPEGTVKAARELARILSPGGQLLVGLPQGRSRVCFNAHRIHSSVEVIAMFAGLRLVEFSGVSDAGRYLENCDPATLDICDYGCGFYRFSK